jgi:hypothetical protein
LDLARLPKADRENAVTLAPRPAAASSSAIAPPKLLPARCGRGSPCAAIQSATRSTSRAIVVGIPPVGTGERPNPGRSMANTSCAAASVSSTGDQARQ